MWFPVAVRWVHKLLCPVLLFTQTETDATERITKPNSQAKMHIETEDQLQIVSMTGELTPVDFSGKNCSCTSSGGRLSASVAMTSPYDRQQVSKVIWRRPHRRHRPHPSPTHLLPWALDPRKSPSETGRWSVQPFLHSAVGKTPHHLPLCVGDRESGHPLIRCFLTPLESTT